MNRKLFSSVVLASAMALSAGSLLAQTDTGAKQDMKNAGSETKDAAKDTGRGIKKGSKKVWHGTKHVSKKAWHGTKHAGHKVKTTVDPN